MFKRKKSLKSKTTKKKASVKKVSPKGENTGVKNVALRLIASPTKKNKDAMLKAIIRSL